MNTKNKKQSTLDRFLKKGIYIIEDKEKNNYKDKYDTKLRIENSHRNIEQLKTLNNNPFIHLVNYSYFDNLYYNFLIHATSQSNSIINNSVIDTIPSTFNNFYHTYNAKECNSNIITKEKNPTECIKDFTIDTNNSVIDEIILDFSDNDEINYNCTNYTDNYKESLNLEEYEKQFKLSKEEEDAMKKLEEEMDRESDFFFVHSIEREEDIKKYDIETSLFTL